jgi:threonine dehydrogenase-like Zn-dependent dehydrogenase
MRGAVLHAPGDVRLEVRDDPAIVERTDAIIRLSATWICGSDLWPHPGIDAVEGPAPMSHEYVGIVGEVGSAVRTITPGQFVIGPRSPHPRRPCDRLRRLLSGSALTRHPACISRIR